MKYLVIVTSVVLGFSLIGCEEEEIDQTKQQLINKWDAYIAIDKNGNTYDYPSDILLNYEHGFELYADGTYT